MQRSQIPVKTPLPFATSGAKNVIPVPSQIGVTPGAASFTDGFPPATRTPVASGGTPPFGQDFNGLFYHVTSLTQWYSAGAPVAFDPAFATAIGGYPAGTMLANPNAPGSFWVSTADNNVNDPDTGQTTGWLNLTIPPTGGYVTAAQLNNEAQVRAAADAAESTNRSNVDAQNLAYCLGSLLPKGQTQGTTVHTNFVPGDGFDVPLVMTFTTGSEPGILFFTASANVTYQNPNSALIRQYFNGTVVNQEQCYGTMAVQYSAAVAANTAVRLEAHYVTTSGGGWSQTALAAAFVFVPN